ncbi:hypothetical protein [Corynebacterium haemomassiliense]|uniref:Secreted protein n=1 Tax=Corynebacterium haemomassiliense TaxID=2754726 RepID=A0A7W2EAS9_9CORY|nr:hypothetical protein [Corynebacterium haemomassiliense]MBA5244301.1 hypothetical protein [Corynebacterium haemomassiliense]
MNRSRTLSAFAAAALAAALLAGCSDSGADAEPLAEPVLDFPQTSTTATPTPTPTEDDDEDEETTTSTSTTTKKSSSSSSSSTKSSTRTSTKSSSKRSESRSSNDSNNAAREPEPVRETIVDDRPGATCAWPTQGAASGNQEYSTFCDREWARTVTSDGQDYYWAAKGQGWVSVDPVTTDDGGVCWAREDFETAPEAIRNAVAFCDPASGEEAE